MFTTPEVSRFGWRYDTVFVTVFCTAFERASCKVHELLRIGEVPTTLTSVILVVAVFPVLTGRSAGTPPPLYPHLHPPLCGLCGRER